MRESTKSGEESRMFIIVIKGKKRTASGAANADERFLEKPVDEGDCSGEYFDK